MLLVTTLAPMTGFRESGTTGLFDKKHLVSPTGALLGRNTPMPAVTLHAVSGHSMTNVPDGVKIAIFVMGCFWSVERLFWQLSDVYSTAAGYTGGYTPNSTHREACSGNIGYAEMVHIVYGPSVISYEQLLQVFWENHDPTQGAHQGNNRGTQYRSAIYPLIPEQDVVAHTSLERSQATMFAVDDDRRITTEVANVTPFYYTKGNHQQYLHKNPYSYYGIGGIGICLPSEA